MSETQERKGFLTPEQEKVLDGLLKFNNKIAESVDGLAIQLIDNQGLERLKAKIEALHPGAVALVYEVVDELFNALEKIQNQSSAD